MQMKKISSVRWMLRQKSIVKIFNFIYTFFAYIITIPLFITWLLFCAILALLGSLVIKKQIAINLYEVKKRDTICGVLNHKGLLSDEEYSFETNEVAALYDKLTFDGYLFILNPIIFLLKHTNFADKFVLYLVHKWMEVHDFKKENKGELKTYFSILAKFCVSIANFVGQFLYKL